MRLSIFGFLIFLWVNYFYPVVEFNARWSYIIILIFSWGIFQWAANWMMRFWIWSQIFWSAFWMLLVLWLFSRIFKSSQWIMFLWDLTSFAIFWALYAVAVFILAIVLGMLQWVWWIAHKMKHKNSQHQKMNQPSQKWGSYFDDLMENK